MSGARLSTKASGSSFFSSFASGCVCVVFFLVFVCVCVGFFFVSVSVVVVLLKD